MQEDQIAVCQADLAGSRLARRYGVIGQVAFQPGKGGIFDLQIRLAIGRGIRRVKRAVAANDLAGRQCNAVIRSVIPLTH